jgi:hypothetical protein
MAYLAERGIALPSLSFIPVSGRHGTVALYNGRDVLEWAEANRIEAA